MKLPKKLTWQRFKKIVESLGVEDRDVVRRIDMFSIGQHLTVKHDGYRKRKTKEFYIFTTGGRCDPCSNG